MRYISVSSVIYEKRLDLLLLPVTIRHKSTNGGGERHDMKVNN